jgi:hypothetical protein
MPAEKSAKSSICEISDLRTSKEIKQKEVLTISAEVGQLAADFEKESKATLSTWLNGISRFNTIVTTTKTAITGAVQGIADKSSGIFIWFKGAYGYLSRKLYYVIAALSVGFFLVGVAVGGTLLNSLVFTVISAVVFLLFVSWWKDSAVSKLNQDYASLHATLETMQNGLGEFNGKLIESHLDLSSLNNIANKLAAKSSNLTSLLPAYDTLTSQLLSEEISTQQKEQFLYLFKNALSSHGVQVEQKSGILQTGYLKGNSENEWLSAVSQRAAEHLGLDQDLLRLLYFDHVQDEPSLREAWAALGKKPQAQISLAKTVMKSELREYLNPTTDDEYQTIVSMMQRLDVFNLSAFRSAYHRYYVEVAQMKVALLDCLADLGYRFSETERSNLRAFTPHGVTEDEWQKEIIEYVSGRLKEPPILVSLFYHTKVGPEASRADMWQRVRATPEEMDRLVQMILAHKLVGVPEQYEKGSSFLAAIIKNELMRSDKFSLEIIREYLSGFLQDIDVKKKTMLLAAERFNMMLTAVEKEAFDTFLPMEQDQLDGIAGRLCSQLRNVLQYEVDRQVLLLLYYVYVNDENKRRLTYEFLLSSKKLLHLATVLLDRQAIKADGEDLAISSANLAILLELLADFVLNDIQDLFSRATAFAALASKMVDYYTAEGLVQGANVDFAIIAHFHISRDYTDEYSRTKALSKYLMDNFSKVETAQNDKDSLIRASTCSFMYYRGVSGASKACSEVVTDLLAAKFLYRHMELRESEPFRAVKTATLSLAIKEVLADYSLDFRFLQDFIIGLGTGVVYNNKRDMLALKAEDISDQLAHRVQLQELVIERMKQSASDFMDAELPEDFLLYAIDAQLVQAYMISVKTQRVPVLTEIVDHNMKLECESLAQNDRLYGNLLLTAEDKTAGGFWTRIGVVPPGMDFDEFNTKFQEVYRRTLGKYLSEHPETNVTKSEVTINLFRLFASPLAFKLIRGSPGLADSEDPSHPIHTVKQLIVKNFGFAKSLELVAVSRPDKERTVLVKKVIVDMLNNKAFLYLIARQELDGVIGQHESLRELLSDRIRFDVNLFAKYHSSNFCEFATTLYKSEKTLDDRGGQLSKLSDYVRDILSNFSIRIRDDELSGLSKVLYLVVLGFGEVLAY